MACLAFTATIQGSSDYVLAKIDSESYEENSYEGLVKSRNCDVSHDTLVRNWTNARKKCKELLVKLTTTKEEKISLQNQFNSAYEHEQSLKVENNS